jgi:hypothetical protein
LGYLQARTTKLVTSARPLIVGHLEPDETLQAMAIGLEGRHPMRRVLIVGGFLIVVNVFLAVQGFELKSWVIGASLGVTAVTAYIGQARWIVLTDRRVMFLSAHPLHQRPTRFLGSHPRNAVRVSSEVQTSWGLRKILYVGPNGDSITWRFARVWDEALERIRNGLSHNLPLPPLS